MRGRLKALAAVALSTIGACRATSATPAVGPASPPPPSCATRPLAFRPRPGVAYHARAEQQHSIYETNLTFTPDGDGWHAVESGFSMNRPMPVETFGDLRGSELRWRLDHGGAPRGEPGQSGSAKPGYLTNMTYYAFAPAGLATGSTCAGTTWEARWEENSRTRTFRYSVESADADRLRVRVDGLVKTPHNEWRIDGTVEVSTEDGLTGTGDLHVTGPGAPAVNDYPRSVSIAPVRDR